MARVARILSIALITAGAVVLADVGLTLAWKEPVSSLYGSLKQGAAADELEDLEASYPTARDLRAVRDVSSRERKVELLARRFAPRVRAGEAVGRLVIPAIDQNVVVVEGTDTASLQKGPGHYPETPLPGLGGTSAIAGHRTTYLAPFRNIDSLEVDDELQLEMPYATFAYRVEKERIVEPEDVEVVRNVGYERLVLSACHPLYSAAQRYIIFARLTEIVVFDAAGGGPWPAT